MKLSALALAMLAVSVRAQTTQFALRTLITPATAIGNYRMSLCDHVPAVAMNDNAEVAFEATCGDDDVLFTSSRVVAKAGDSIGGKFIHKGLRVIAINNHGQVLYKASFSDEATPPDADYPPDGLFLDDRFIGTVQSCLDGSECDYRLLEDGSVRSESPLAFAKPESDTKACHSKDPSAEAIPALDTKDGIYEMPELVRNHCGELLLPLSPLKPFFVLATPVSQ